MRTFLKMNRATAPMLDFAKLLIAQEAGGSKASRTRPSAFDIFEKLRPHMATLMGKGGFRALLARALVLASGEIPWLRAVQVNEEGILKGGEELQAQLDPDEFLESQVVLLAQMLGLLVAFIGEVLTVRLMRGVWPKVMLDDLDFGGAGKPGDHQYEKAK